jgi:hypothetical protein
MDGERGRPTEEGRPTMISGSQWQRSPGAARCVTAALAAARLCSPHDPVTACAEFEGVPHVIWPWSSCLPRENAGCCSSVQEEEIAGRKEEIRHNLPILEHMHQQP